jgi:hypothetical protein
VGHLINDAFEPVFNLLNDKEDIVVINTLNGLGSIAEFYPGIFSNHQNIKDIIAKLFTFLNTNNNQSNIAALTIFKNIT